MRSLARVLIALLGVGSLGGATAAQEIVVPSFPAAAIIRGEFIRLRAEPAGQTQEVAILERGDEITITGEALSADGFIFYPIEVLQTGDVGWVRALFINPDSIVPLLETAPAPAPEPAPEPEPEPEPAPAPEDDAELARQERREQRQREREAAAAEEPVVEPVDEPVTQDEAEAPLVDDEPLEPIEEAPVEEEPVEEPADEPAEEPAASVAGEDAMASEPFTLQPGRYRIVGTLDATDATGFVVNLLGPRNFNESLFEDEIDPAQPWTVRTSLTIDREGEYVIEVVEAAGPWVIEFLPRG